MSRNWRLKLGLLVAAVVIAVLYVTPSLTNMNPETSKFPFKKKVNLGLDLQGGLYMVYSLDLEKMYRESMRKQLAGLTEDAAKEQIILKVLPAPDKYPDVDDPRQSIEVDAAKKTALLDIAGKRYPSLQVVTDQGGKVEFGFTRPYRTEMADRTLSQSIQVIRNRIDEFGVSEPSISSQGRDRVVVELPGIKDIERAKALVGRTAKLEFKIVDDDDTAKLNLPELIASIQKDHNIQYKDGDKLSEYIEQINKFAQGKIPNDTEISFERSSTSRTAQLNTLAPYLLYNKVDVSGADLADASVLLGQYGEPEVAFQLEPAGALRFEKLTGDNVRKRLAIVLDGIIYSAPVINSKIKDRGTITLGNGDRQKAMQEAKDLALVLRAGALPAQLELSEQRVIGPSLGEDSINKGLHAGIVGCLLVFVFMIAYYRGSGVIAVFSLCLNLLFTFAILIGLDATLTLPGIAGLALTIGMAVDSNVIIFERIRDELEEGATVAGAVERGFDRAFTCIFDANITHGIVALILFNFGTGPIKGFAITLLIGIFTTLFCAVTVAKLCFDGWIGPRRNRIEILSI
jgi:protein-export membrane protein SecD